MSYVTVVAALRRDEDEEHGQLVEDGGPDEAVSLTAIWRAMG